MSRVIFLVNDLTETHQIVHELETAGIKEKNVHVYGNEPGLLKKEHLHPANSLYIANLITVIGRGVVMGMIFSAVILTLFLIELPSDIKIHALGYVGIIGFGVSFGLWVSGLIGLETVKHFMEKYKNYVGDGHYLMMIDTSPKRENELTEMITHQHSHVHLEEAIHH